MRIVYHAENLIDANLVKGLLEEAQILAFVNGSFLQGGIGELPAGDLVSVSVAEIDVDRANPIVEKFTRDLADGVFERTLDDDQQWNDPLPDPS